MRAVIGIRQSSAVVVFALHTDRHQSQPTLTPSLSSNPRSTIHPAILNRYPYKQSLKQTLDFDLNSAFPTTDVVSHFLPVAPLHSPDHALTTTVPPATHAVWLRRREQPPASSMGVPEVPHTASWRGRAPARRLGCQASSSLSPSSAAYHLVGRWITAACSRRYRAISGERRVGHIDTLKPWRRRPDSVPAAARPGITASN